MAFAFVAMDSPILSPGGKVGLKVAGTGQGMGMGMGIDFRLWTLDLRFGAWGLGRP